MKIFISGVAGFLGSYLADKLIKEGLQSMIDYIKERGVKKFKYHLDLEIINELTPDTWKDRLF